MRRGVTVVVLLSLAAASTAAGARAGGGATTATTTTPAAPARIAPSSLPAGCVGAGTAAIVLPHHPTVALGAPAKTSGSSDYMSRNELLAYASSVERGSQCGHTSLTLSGVSLFGGAVSATSVRISRERNWVRGLLVNGVRVRLGARKSIGVGDWGRVSLATTAGRLSAPLSVRLLKAHDSLPAGTVVLVAFAAAPRPVAVAPQQAAHVAAPKAHHHAKKNLVLQPLKWTPHLGFKPSSYVFPVAGGASYIDTYGANRSDIYDGWHHGDDLFAPLGTPVVAVRAGTLSLVGWNELGGWRLWLTDAKGNSFYYAHLAGYARWILHAKHVHAGQVLGFLGRTGDAFTTTPHLHFEIHPHQPSLIARGYDGAVDPTTYLKAWTVEHVAPDQVPQPARLRAPRGTPAEEAAVVWHQLLVARRALAPAHPVAAPPTIRRPLPPTPKPETIPAPAQRRLAAVRTAAHYAPLKPVNDGPWPAVTLAGTALLLAAMLPWARRRRRRRQQA